MIIQSKLLNKCIKKKLGVPALPQNGMLQVSREFKMNSYIVEIIFEGHKNDKRILRLRPLFRIGHRTNVLSTSSVLPFLYT